jgi:hypothetical protein
VRLSGIASDVTVATVGSYLVDGQDWAGCIFFQ